VSWVSSVGDGCLRRPEVCHASLLLPSVSGHFTLIGSSVVLWELAAWGALFWRTKADGPGFKRAYGGVLGLAVQQSACAVFRGIRLTRGVAKWAHGATGITQSVGISKVKCLK